MAELRKTGESQYDVLVHEQTIGQVWNWLTDAIFPHTPAPYPKLGRLRHSVLERRLTPLREAYRAPLTEWQPDQVSGSHVPSRRRPAPRHRVRK
jgi:hypothetical protein